MESHKVSKNGMSLTLDNGLVLTYCEFGTEHEEVVVSGAFYFHTFTPVLEELAKRYHVYGVVMRINEDGPITQRNTDGSVNWGRQWGEDIYRFTQALGVEQFHYVGKCHGANPGWYLLKEHPEVLYTLGSFYMAPHLCPRNSHRWTEVPAREGPMALIGLSMRHQERIPLKIAEVRTLGEAAGGGPEAAGGDPDVGKYGESPELIWDTLEECEVSLKNIETPVLLVFGTDDLLFQDHLDSNLKAMGTIRRAKTVLIQGERHLMEMDCPERMAREMSFFIDESKKND